MVGKNEMEDVPEEYGVCGYILIGLMLGFVVILFPLTIWYCIRVVKEYERR